MKVLVGVPTYGNLLFTKLTIEHIKKTTKIPYDLFVIVGKFEDDETKEYCKTEGINHLVHSTNRGLPCSVNDLYDAAFVKGDYDALVVVGNDALPYWDAIDKLVAHTKLGEYDWVSGTVVSIHNLLSKIPECSKYFKGGEKNMNFVGSDLPEWLEQYKPHLPARNVVDMAKFAIVGDTHNLCLFTRKLFETVGYIDTNFFPAYYEDNDYARRAQLLNMRMCRLVDSRYFHFWSRTIHQGGMQGTNNKYFPLNKKYYIKKWGNIPGKEKFTKPFNGAQFEHSTIRNLNINSREDEIKILQEWKAK